MSASARVSRCYQPEGRATRAERIWGDRSVRALGERLSNIQCSGLSAGVLAEALAKLETTAGVASFIYLHPMDWANLQKNNYNSITPLTKNPTQVGTFQGTAVIVTTMCGKGDAWLVAGAAPWSVAGAAPYRRHWQTVTSV